jgi:hypothetical protein
MTDKRLMVALVCDKEAHLMWVCDHNESGVDELIVVVPDEYDWTVNWDVFKTQNLD